MIHEGDVFLVQGGTHEILKVKDTAGIDIKADMKLADPDLETEDTGMVETIILPRSPLIGRTLKEQGFREHYGLQVLGVNRHGTTIRRKMSALPLQMGDVLLVQGPRAKIQEARMIRRCGCWGSSRRNGRRRSARRSGSGFSFS